ncbi:MAG TPA: GNAT family N-acetyltransferase [Acidimicrobiia bacterium]|nr:GNAT family N-acetyltransferase [Acidimicrobiia bacterium]
MRSLAFERAHPGDWPAIWRIFQAVVSSGDTYPYPPDIAEEAARAIWIRDAEREATYVARLDEEIVATSYLKANGVGLSDHIANAGWMVAPEHRGEGIGRRFAEYVIDQARGMGYGGMQFNSVVATNETAVALWESLGFEIVGTVPNAFRHVQHGPTPAHIMYRDL